MKDLIQIAPQVARGKFTEDLWTNPNYFAQEKLDGERFKMHIFKESNRFDSRCLSKKTNLFTEKTGNVMHLANWKVPELAGTVLDGEMKTGTDSMSTSTIMGCLPEEAVRRQAESGIWVDYYIFDVIFYCGKDLRDFSYLARKEVLDKIYREHLSKNPHFVLPAVATKDKKKFCEDIFKAGGEGVILKNVRAPYTDKTAWVKVKAVATYDVVVTGLQAATLETIKKGDDKATISRLAANGWCGALLFGQYVNGKLRELGRCSGMPDDIRADFSVNKLKIGTVITIEAQSRIVKTGKFRHPRFLCLRLDKNEKDCIYYENES